MKYRLTEATQETKGLNTAGRAVYRLVALKDIPLYGVREGDLGGLVDSARILSQEGDCWIAAGARAIGNVSIREHAYIGDNASVYGRSDKFSISISGVASVKGNAKVLTSEDNEAFQNTVLKEKVKIYDNAILRDAGEIFGTACIHGFAEINGASEVSGASDIFEKAKINSYARILGRSSIFGNAIVKTEAVVENSRIMGNAVILIGAHLKNAQYSEDGTMLSGEIAHRDPKSLNNSNTSFALGAVTANHITHNHFSTDISPTKPVVLSVETQDALNLLEEVKNDIASYESDIVKIIKYPVMTDRTDSYTLAMMQALKLANRLAMNPTHTGFVASVFDLEKKFLAAESHVLKMASSGLSELELKKTTRASDLLAIAANEASTEQEKKVAFQQAFKQLEGVVMVPDVAVEAFRVKIGLKELEA